MMCLPLPAQGTVHLFIRVVFQMSYKAISLHRGGGCGSGSLQEKSGWRRMHPTPPHQQAADRRPAGLQRDIVQATVGSAPGDRIGKEDRGPALTKHAFYLVEAGCLGVIQGSLTAETREKLSWPIGDK